MDESAYTAQIDLCDHCDASVQYPYLPTSHKVRSDYVPTNDDIKEAVSSIAEMKEALGQINMTLDRVRGILGSLETSKAKLEKQIEEQMAIISPLRKIPVEVYHKIFSHACDADENATEWDYALRVDRNQLRAPANQISLTSSHWRNIAVGYPPIWSSISVDLCATAHWKLSTTTLLSTYLKNAGTNVLKIRVFSDTRCTEQAARLLACRCDGGFDAFRLLLAHMKYCEKLRLHITGHALLKDLVGTPNLRFPALRYFHNGVGMTDDVDVASTSWFWQAIGKAPCLTQLHEEFFSLPPRVDVMPYEQLTTFRFWHADKHHRFLRIIRKARNLKRLSLLWDSPDSPGSAVSSPYELASLQELHICPSHPENFLTFIELVRAPKLTSLWIVCDPLDFDPEFERPHPVPLTFMSTLSRLPSTLQRLHIDLNSFYPSNTSMSGLLFMFPNLTYFDICWSSDQLQQDRMSLWMSHLLDTLKVSSASPSSVVAPKLEELVLHESHSRIDSGSIEQLLTTLESRSSSRLANIGRLSEIVALRKVDFSYWTNRGTVFKSSLPVDKLLTDEHRQRLRALEEDGMACLLEERWNHFPS
ncbi:hypothetical protein VNI00_012776 [Paramarasmius palmivorus]|uniref:F-box domain-containing protein n=1 Tax=Paramarasmius palmivorus TaxID=297713 RepID=A0AAW0C2C8_9AGAR